MHRPRPAALVALLLALPLGAAAEEPRLLMVGNSYTASNDLPALVAAALRDTVPAYGAVAAQGHSPGGATLADHAAQADGTAGDTALRQLMVTGPDAGSWDWVFLQDQSQVPGLPPAEPAWQASLAGAVTLDGLAVQGGAATAFLLTWGRRDGDSQNPALYPDFATMQQRLLDGYQAYAAAASADGTTAWIAPAGLAFARVHDDLVAAGQDPTAEGTLFHALYGGDGSHPALPGSYLAALTVAAALSGWPVDGAGAPPGLDESTAAALQGAVDALVWGDPFGPVAYRWAFAWDAWSSPGGEPSAGTVIVDPVTLPTVRVATPTTVADAVIVGADHGPLQGAGRLWLEEPLTIEDTLVVASTGHLELHPDEAAELLLDAGAAVLLAGRTSVVLDDGLALDAAGSWDLVQAPAIDATAGTLHAPDGFTLGVEGGGTGQVLRLAWGGAGDDDGADDDDTAGDDDGGAGDDDTAGGPRGGDDGGGGCTCRCGHGSTAAAGAAGAFAVLGWAVVVARRRA